LPLDSSAILGARQDWLLPWEIQVGRTVTVALTAFTLALSGTSVFGGSNCKLVKIAEWRVNPEAGRVIVEGAVNGQKVGIMFDTGSQRSLVLRAAADRLGLTRQEARGYRYVGIGGETYAEQTIIEEFKLGQAIRKNWRVLVAGEHDFGPAYSVLLGYEFFETVDLEFDLPNSAVRLFQAQDCSDTPLAYWGGLVDVVKLEIDNARPKILVPVKLNGKPLLAELDSGSSTVVSHLVAAQLGVTPDSPGTRAIGKVTGFGAARPDQWIGNFDSFSIGGEIIRNPQLRFTTLQVSTAAETGSRLATREEVREMLLGIDFLRAHRVYVAHSQGKVYFTYSGGRVFAPPPPQPAAEK
jgi:predicted aspartyl protease